MMDVIFACGKEKKTQTKQPFLETDLKNLLAFQIIIIILDLFLVSHRYLSLLLLQIYNMYLHNVLWVLRGTGHQHRVSTHRTLSQETLEEHSRVGAKDVFFCTRTTAIMNRGWTHGMHGWMHACMQVSPCSLFEQVGSVKYICMYYHL